MISCSSANRPSHVYHLQATVLEIEGNGRIFAHHNAFHGMPAMTMEFAVQDPSKLQPGDLIEADVDTNGDVWSLSNVKRHPRAVVQASARIPLVVVGDRLPDVVLHDQNGAVRRWKDFVGHPFALSFIYTRCQDPRMCPATTAKFVQAAHLLAAGRARFAELTLDPEHDTPRVLRVYQHRYGIDPKVMVLLLSESRSTKAFAERLGVLERAVPGAILHTERVVIVDARGRIKRFFNDTDWRATDVAAALSLIL